MAYRERVGWTPANYIIENHRAEVKEADRKEHLRRVTGTLVTSREPGEGAHIRDNMKRAIARDVEFAQIEHENLLLLSKLHKTSVRPSSSGPSRLSRKGQRSMNLRNRRAEIERIERENKVRLYLHKYTRLTTFLTFLPLTIQNI